jgi:uncharacterized protein YqhQ
MSLGSGRWINSFIHIVLLVVIFFIALNGFDRFLVRLVRRERSLLLPDISHGAQKPLRHGAEPEERLCA